MNRVAEERLEAVTRLAALALAGACLALLVGCSTPDGPPSGTATGSGAREELAPPGELAPDRPEEAARSTGGEEVVTPAPQPEVEPAEERSPDTVDEAPPCDIRILSTLDAHVYRGVPSTPALEASRQRRSPEQLARDTAYDHGVRYLSCDYVVELDGTRYLHTYNAGSSPFERPDADDCEADETKASAVARLRRSTRDCTDLDRGAYYGVTLEPMR